MTTFLSVLNSVLLGFVAGGFISIIRCRNASPGSFCGIEYFVLVPLFILLFGVGFWVASKFLFRNRKPLYFYIQLFITLPFIAFILYAMLRELL